MNVLINAYAVSPNWGSEQGMGWNWISSLAPYCNLFIITEGQWRDEIEAAVAVHPHREHLHFFYNPVSDRVRKMCWNQGDWRFYYHYRKWQKKTLKIARSIIAEQTIDIIHQLNMVGFREPGYLWKIKEIPFIWGPIGGMESAPLKALAGESFRIILFQTLKNTLTWIQAHFSPRVRKALKHSKTAIAATKGTFSIIKNYYCHPDVRFINETGTDNDNTYESDKAKSEIFHILWVGKFIYSKKLDLALMTMALMKEKGYNVHLSIAGSGSAQEITRYKQFAEKLSVTDMVSWLGIVPNAQLKAQMHKYDLFFFTSISEATSTVVPEAICNNLPILCFNACGFGPLVKGKTGETIEITSPANAAEAFAEKIINFINHPQELDYYAKSCDIFKQELSWQYKASLVYEIYSKTL